jgi:hypothetical protein
VNSIVSKKAMASSHRRRPSFSSCSGWPHSTPLAHVIDAVRWCFDRQLPAPERAYRLAVLDPSVAAAGALVIETGDRLRGDLATYVYPDDPPGSPPGRSREEAAHLFVETVARHLRASSLRRQDQ